MSFRTIWFGSMLSIMFFASCNESLPVREDLTRLFSTTVSSGFFRTNGVNYLRFFVTVKNTSDETIQERASIHGTMDVAWLPSTAGQTGGRDVKRTFTINSTNIFRSSGYNASTGMLLLPSNDSIVFVVYWNMRSNDSTFLPHLWSFALDNQCDVRYANNVVRNRKVYLRQQFQMSASVKLFDRLAFLYSAPTTVSECYVVEYVSEANPSQNPCTNINIVNPCDLIE